MSETKEERNAKICERYLAGETAEEIATDVGLSMPSIRLILREGGALTKDRVQRIRTQEERVISPLHAKIGAMVSHYRSFARGIDRRMAAEEIGWSMQRLASVERGFHNMTLVDLQDIARFLEKPIEEVVNGQSKTKHAPSHGANPGVVPFPRTRSKTEAESAGAGVEDTSERRPGLQDQKEA